MIFIYNCYAGTHSSSIASAIHLGQIDGDRVPGCKEILNISYFNKLDGNDIGKIIYRGTDDEGNKVYTLGRGSSKFVIPSMAELMKIICSQYHINEKIVFSNMTSTVTPAMSLGGFMSRRLKMDFLAVPILLSGSREAFLKISSLVKKTREQAKHAEGPVVVFENKI
jgi:hypothetical protein